MKVSLAIDNCFASKRWTKPAEWMSLIHELGIKYVEASADNEIDPFYSTPDFIERWIGKVQESAECHNIQVANLYSGHGSYSTLGLGHYDRGVREHIQFDWLQEMLQNAAKLNAGIGFFAHAFAEFILSDQALYAQACHDLITAFQKLSQFAQQQGIAALGIEQMYSPHQIPWTLDGTRDFLLKANQKASGCPIYITLDTGHQVGQSGFLPPTDQAIADFYESSRNHRPSDIYLGTWEGYLGLLAQTQTAPSLSEMIEAVRRYVAEYPYLFSSPADGDPYQWIEQFGYYSPIIHLQQTNGSTSGHQPFTCANNATGIIQAPKVLQALANSCLQEGIAGVPKVAEIYLTLEIFLPTACNTATAIKQIAESVTYWRKYIPEDDMELDEVIERTCVDPKVSLPTISEK